MSCDNIVFICSKISLYWILKPLEKEWNFRGDNKTKAVFLWSYDGFKDSEGIYEISERNQVIVLWVIVSDGEVFSVICKQRLRVSTLCWLLNICLYCFNCVCWGSDCFLADKILNDLLRASCMWSNVLHLKNKRLFKWLLFVYM